MRISVLEMRILTASGSMNSEVKLTYLIKCCTVICFSYVHQAQMTDDKNSNFKPSSEIINEGYER